jgi:hypothetical protein
MHRRAQPRKVGSRCAYGCRPVLGRVDTYTAGAVRGDGLLRRLALGVAIVAAAAAVPLAASAAGIWTLHLGGTFTVTGHAAGQATGKVVVRWRWGSEPYELVTTTRTDRVGRYSFVVKPQRRGVFTIEIAPPDHQPKRLVLRVL